MNYVWIFIGGGLGSIARFELGQRIARFTGTAFPFATLGINILSCFILGIIMQVFAGKGVLDQTARLLLAVGFCGGFSTFSTFTWEGFELIKSGQYVYAGAYVLLSVLICFLGFWAGWTVAR